MADGFKRIGLPLCSLFSGSVGLLLLIFESNVRYHGIIDIAICGLYLIKAALLRKQAGHVLAILLIDLIDKTAPLIGALACLLQGIEGVGQGALLVHEFGIGILEGTGGRVGRLAEQGKVCGSRCQC